MFKFWYVLVFDVLLLGVLFFAALGNGTRRAVLAPGENPLDNPDRWLQARDLKTKRLLFVIRVWLLIAAPLTLAAWFYVNFKIVSAKEPDLHGDYTRTPTPLGQVSTIIPTTLTRTASPTWRYTLTPSSTPTPRQTQTPSLSPTVRPSETPLVIYRSNTVIETRVVTVNQAVVQTRVVLQTAPVIQTRVIYWTTTPLPTYTLYPTYTVYPTYTLYPSPTELTPCPPDDTTPTPTETPSETPTLAAYP